MRTLKLAELLVCVILAFSWPFVVVNARPECFALQGVAWRVRRTVLCHTATCAFESPAVSLSAYYPTKKELRQRSQAKGCKRKSLSLLSDFPSSFQQAAEHATLLRRQHHGIRMTRVTEASRLWWLCARAGLSWRSPRRTPNSRRRAATVHITLLRHNKKPNLIDLSVMELSA